MLKNVMRRAWEIARKGQENYGGKVSEYLSKALKIAWAEIKTNKEVTITTTSGSRRHKSWVAEITGTHPRWKLNREFVEADNESWMEKTFTLVDGIYEVCNAGDREFIEIVNGVVESIEYSEVIDQVA